LSLFLNLWISEMWIKFLPFACGILATWCCIIALKSGEISFSTRRITDDPYGLYTRRYNLSQAAPFSLVLAFDATIAFMSIGFSLFEGYLKSDLQIGVVTFIDGAALIARCLIFFFAAYLAAYVVVKMRQKNHS
jgi:hypothetical protein